MATPRSAPRAAVAHYRRMQRLQTRVTRDGRRAWRRLDAGALDASFPAFLAALRPALAGTMVEAASDADGYVTAALAAQGAHALPDVVVQPGAFGLAASDGRTLDGLLRSPIVTVKEAIGSGLTAPVAMRAGLASLDRIVRMQVNDAGRLAAGVAITARPGVGYVRMLNPPSCSRCVVLAGKHFRWNAGFRRHPRCDCVHIPAAEDSGDLTTDPYDYFRSLSPEDQAKVFGEANAAAINDGADIYQVVNARRGMAAAGQATTREGVQSRRGFAAQSLHGGPLPRYSRPTMTRLTPEGIYARAGSRAEAVDLLRQNGYLTARRPT